MKSRDFCYWLQGYFELAKPTELRLNEIEEIKNHLKMVFIHEIDSSFPKGQQADLNTAHKPSILETAVMRC